MLDSNSTEGNVKEGKRSERMVSGWSGRHFGYGTWESSFGMCGKRSK